MTTPQVKGFFDHNTNTVSYVVSDPQTKNCAIIDSVLDYDPASGRTTTTSADLLLAYIHNNGLTLQWILETHAHADHLSAAPYIKQKLGGTLAIGEHIKAVQEVFGRVFNVGPEFRRDGSQFDTLFKQGDNFCLGSIECQVLHTPGHTPACITYLIGDAAFVGDTLFMPDYGSARCDFPGGDAKTLYQSVQKIFALPPETRLFMCHDYLPTGRHEYQWETTVAAQRNGNIHLKEGTTEDAFVAMRRARDATLAMPRLILPSVQINMRAGHLPEAEANGVSYLKLPVNAL